MTDTVRYELHEHAAWLTLASPENRNALSTELCNALQARLREASSDPAARVIVLAAEGRAFCAGADLKTGGGGAVGTGNGPAPYTRVLQALWECPKPVVARVQGPAYGGGLGLVSAADIAVCANEAHFAFSEVRLGVAPAIVAVVALRKMDYAKVSELFLTGRRYSAAEAQAAGLVHRVVPAEALDDAMATLLDQLRQGGPAALQHTKRLLRTMLGLTFEEGLEHAQHLSERLFRSEEGQAGVTAFTAKQKPPWAE